MTNTTQVAKWNIGQLIRHRMFEYRGVIYDVDAQFMLSDAWYDQVARSRPPKDEPWYKVLVDGSDHETYVAQRNLEAATDLSPISHPLTDELFSGFEDGRYMTRDSN